MTLRWANLIANSHGWQDCETGVVALLAVDNSREGINYSKRKTNFSTNLGDTHVHPQRTDKSAPKSSWTPCYHRILRANNKAVFVHQNLKWEIHRIKYFGDVRGSTDLSVYFTIKPLQEEYNTWRTEHYILDTYGFLGWYRAHYATFCDKRDFLNQAELWHEWKLNTLKTGH